MTDEADERGNIVMGLAASMSRDDGTPWDTSPLTIAHELRRHILATIGDAGKGCDSGGGDGIADLHPWIGGREYHIQIKATVRD